MTILSVPDINGLPRSGRQRKFGTHCGSSIHAALDPELAVQRLDSVTDIGQPAGTDTVRLEPPTLVLNHQTEPAVRMRKPDVGAVGAGVLGHIGQRLAGHEIRSALYILSEPLGT